MMRKVETSSAVLEPRPRNNGRKLIALDLPSCGDVKWGSVTRVIPDRANLLVDLADRICPMNQPPRAHDVMIAQVTSVGRHAGIELDSGRKAGFAAGDVLGLAFGFRYATRQFYGEVPPLLTEYHMLSQGGVSGRVCSAPNEFLSPTVVKPIGYLCDADGATVNLRDHAFDIVKPHCCVPTILVVGSAMDSGKTTAAANLIRGLCRAGYRVHGGKLTGTGCMRDLLRMHDAGASRVMDFTSVGFASTSMASQSELQQIADVLYSQLSADHPDCLVLEIADGLVQRETKLMMSHLASNKMFDHLLLAIHDTMAAPTCVDILRRLWDIGPTAISGAATISPLSTEELQNLVDLPCLRKEDLASPMIATKFFLQTNPKPVVS